MTELILIIIALLLLVSSAGMIVKMYLENTKEEREYKRIAKKLETNAKSLKNVKENNSRITSWIRSEWEWKIIKMTRNILLK